MPTAARKLAISLTPTQLELVCEALDSHVYWQLSDPFFRRGGYVDLPGSEDPEAVHAIGRARSLLARLERLSEPPIEPAE